MMRVWPVIRREYVERVRSRAFVIGTLLGPLVIALMMWIPLLVVSRQSGRPLRVAIIDASGIFQKEIEETLARQKTGGQPQFSVVPAMGRPEETRSRLRAEVLQGTLDGYLYLPAEILERPIAEYHGRNVSNVTELRLLNSAVETVLTSRRLVAAGLDPLVVKGLTRRLDLRTMKISPSGEREDHGGSLLVSVTLMLMLYTSVMMWGQALMLGVIEEKSSRVVEVAVSSMPPVQFLAGKLLGVGAAGLTQFSAWVATMGFLGRLGGGAVGTIAPQGLPELTPLILGSFVLFFLLGYFLYGALYVAIGASVNSQQEAQSLVLPVISPLVVGMLVFPTVVTHPEATLSTGLSLIPFLSPILMFLRISVFTPPVWQIALSVALTTMTIAGVNWAAARIYRVGILMYGKRPTPREILKWIWRP